MKYALPLLAVLSLGIAATGAELSEELKDLQDKYKSHMKVWNLDDDDIEENNKEYFVLSFLTRQDIRDEGVLKYQLYVTIQVTDKKTETTVYAQTISTPEPLPDEDSEDRYDGQTQWEFRIPFGEMKKPKLSACAIEFGFTEGSRFVPVATLYEDVDSADEIMNGDGTKVRMHCTQNEHSIRTAGDRSPGSGGRNR